MKLPFWIRRTNFPGIGGMPPPIYIAGVEVEICVLAAGVELVWLVGCLHGFVSISLTWRSWPPLGI